MARLPRSTKILLENVLRHNGDHAALPDAAYALTSAHSYETEIPLYPTRVLMPDSSGLPLIADLAAMRDAAVTVGTDPRRINPIVPVDLVLDHSLVVDLAGRANAAQRNLDLEIARNVERYKLVRWAEKTLNGLRVIPPGNGICHQINLERLARVVWTVPDGDSEIACCDTLIGTDSHTPMVNSLCVLGWGVGGIEAATAMLGEPIEIRAPEVIGCRLIGRLSEGVSTTDLALTVTQRLRARGVVGAFVEFCGPGMHALSLPQRATLSNMAPEYGATIGLFAIDQKTLKFLALTGRDEAHIQLVERYAKLQGLWSDESIEDPVFSDTVEIDLGSVEASAAGPRRPQDRVALSKIPAGFRALANELPAKAQRKEGQHSDIVSRLHDGDVVIAAITSCTNTSNPTAMIEAGLLARNAAARGLQAKPWVKTSLAPGSRVVADYLLASGLQEHLDILGFQVVGFGCTTCMGNSGPLSSSIAQSIQEEDIVAVAILSGNRNFDGRIHNLVRANYLMSPALVVAYALAGSILIDLSREPLGHDRDGHPVYLADLQPKAAEVDAWVAKHVGPAVFRSRIMASFTVPDGWQELDGGNGDIFSWNTNSTHVQRPPFLADLSAIQEAPHNIIGARALLILGDSITTDHISPVSEIPPDSEAGCYLISKGIAPTELGSYMTRRTNHNIMLRGTFANMRLRNELVPGREGGVTRHMPDNREMSIHEAACCYASEGTPLIVIAGSEYGAGSSRDWAAKGTRLLGIRAVLAESFERIHRSNLIGMGVLPLQFESGVTRRSLYLRGEDSFDIVGLDHGLEPGQRVIVMIHRVDGRVDEATLICRIDTAREFAWYRHGGIMPLAMRRLMEASV